MGSVAGTCGWDLLPRLVARTCGQVLWTGPVARTYGEDLLPRLVARTRMSTKNDDVTEKKREAGREQEEKNKVSIDGASA